MMPEPKTIIDEFCIVCTSARNDFDLYQSLFETDRRALDLFSSVAPLCFGDICRTLKENLYIQFCKITDPAKTGKKANLTTNYIVEEILWPDAVGQRLREVNGRLMSSESLSTVTFPSGPRSAVSLSSPSFKESPRRKTLKPDCITSCMRGRTWPGLEPPLLCRTRSNRCRACSCERPFASLSPDPAP